MNYDASDTRPTRNSNGLTGTAAQTCLWWLTFNPDFISQQSYKNRRRQTEPSVQSKHKNVVYKKTQRQILTFCAGFFF